MHTVVCILASWVSVAVLARSETCERKMWKEGEHMAEVVQQTTVLAMTMF